MTENSYKVNAAIFKALSDEKRLRIVAILRNGEMCACEIGEALSIAQSTLSYHMKMLTESGLIVDRNEGKWVKYCINREKFELIKEYFKLCTKEC